MHVLCVCFINLTVFGNNYYFIFHINPRECAGKTENVPSFRAANVLHRKRYSFTCLLCSEGKVCVCKLIYNVYYAIPTHST